MPASSFYNTCLTQMACYMLGQMRAPGLQEHLCFQDIPVGFITCKYLFAVFVTSWSYEPVKLSEQLCTAQIHSTPPVCVNQYSSTDLDRVGSIYARWGAHVTTDITPKWPVIKTPSCFFSLQAYQHHVLAADCMFCHMPVPHAQQMALMFTKSIVWGEREKTTAMITRTWHCFCPIWALFGYQGYSRSSACLLCAGTNGSLWFPGGTSSCPLLWLWDTKCLLSAWLQFLRIPAVWTFGAAAPLSPASENHSYY